MPDPRVSPSEQAEASRLSARTSPHSPRTHHRPSTSWARGPPRPSLAGVTATLSRAQTILHPLPAWVTLIPPPVWATFAPSPRGAGSPTTLVRASPHAVSLARPRRRPLDRPAGNPHLLPPRHHPEGGPRHPRRPPPRPWTQAWQAAASPPRERFCTPYRALLSSFFSSKRQPPPLPSASSPPLHEGG